MRSWRAEAPRAALPHVGIVLTNDGHAILREIDVAHPAAKVQAAALYSWPARKTRDSDG